MIYPKQNHELCLINQLFFQRINISGIISVIFRHVLLVIELDTTSDIQYKYVILNHVTTGHKIFLCIFYLLTCLM